jgi:hypothetical protein
MSSIKVETRYWSFGYKLIPKDYRGKPDTTANYHRKFEKK